MSILKILKYPDIKLRQKSNNINEINAKIKKISQDMIDTMYHYKGLGIAAPQIGINKKIIIINIINKKKQPLIIINPIIINKNKITKSTEGCLSFPDIFIDVIRKKNIKIKFLTINGNTRTLKSNELLSICIQHEIDHLEGITLYDKANKSSKNIILKNLK